jgi:hypothetical protein
MNGLEFSHHLNKFLINKNSSNNICIHSAFVDQETRNSLQMLQIEQIIKKPCTNE